MGQQFGHERFWTEYVDDHTDGYAGFRLHRQRFGQSALVAQVIFWDAAGHFALQTFDGDVPVEIIEAVISEAREFVRVK